MAGYNAGVGKLNRLMWLCWQVEMAGVGRRTCCAGKLKCQAGVASVGRRRLQVMEDVKPGVGRWKP